MSKVYYNNLTQSKMVEEYSNIQTRVAFKVLALLKAPVNITPR